jgi:DNA polymerase III psi subunit
MDVAPARPLMAKPLLQEMLRCIPVDPEMDMVFELGVDAVGQLTAAM